MVKVYTGAWAFNMASSEKANGGLGQKPCAKEMTYDLKRALSDLDGQTGDEAERCTSGVATRREGSPLPIRAMQGDDENLGLYESRGEDENNYIQMKLKLTKTKRSHS